MKRSGVARATDLVLVGDGCEGLPSLLRELKTPMALWVLAPAMKKALVDLYGLHDEEVSVIPRSTLYPSKTPARSASELLASDETLTLVYAGRLSASKGFHRFLDFANNVQHTRSSETRVDVFGDIDNIDNPYFGGSVENYERVIAEVMTKRRWRMNPRFHGWRESDEWISMSGPNPIFCSLSTYFREDFGVSAAQAREAGWPAILSAYGGHLAIAGADFIDANVLHQPIEVELAIGSEAVTPRSATSVQWKAPREIDVPRARAILAASERRWGKPSLSSLGLGAQTLHVLGEKKFFEDHFAAMTSRE